MKLTVCVCTHNRPAYVRDCLDGLRRQTAAADRFSVLIVDSASPGPARSELAALTRDYPNAGLIRVDAPGVGAARNAGAKAAASGYIAYIDDDAIPAEDWIAAILAALEPRDRPAFIGGRILPRWEAPLPVWWPPGLRGLLSIIEYEGSGEFRTRELSPGLEPYGCNMVVDVALLLDAGGFRPGRIGAALLSDEEIQIAWRLQDAGYLVEYDSRLVVNHQIQARRLNPAWLLSRLYWQGASTVLTRRLLHAAGAVWRELPRRLCVLVLFAPAALLPERSTLFLALRWRWAYAAGFVRAAFGWRVTDAAKRVALPGPAFPGPAFPGPAFAGPAFPGQAFPGPAFPGPDFPATAGGRAGGRGVIQRPGTRMILYQWRGPHRNFGDELNGVLWPRLLPDFFDDDAGTIFLGIGSVLDQRHDPAAIKLVAGAGYGGYQQRVTLDETWDVRWVRGPRTAAQLDLPTTLGVGDPGCLVPLAGLVLPRMTATQREPTRGEPIRGEPIRGEPIRGEPTRSEPTRGEPTRSEPSQGEPTQGVSAGEHNGAPKQTPGPPPGVIGFMPHFESAIRGAWGEVCALAGATLIDPRGDPLDIIAAIGRCRVVISEALHGIIVSDALRVPWIAIRPNAPIHRPKWADWADTLELSVAFHHLPPSSALERAHLTRLSGFHYGRALLHHQDARLRAVGRRRHIAAAAEALREVMGMDPQLSRDTPLDRVRCRMMDLIADLRRAPAPRRTISPGSPSSPRSPVSAASPMCSGSPISSGSPIGSGSPGGSGTAILKANAALD